MLVRCLLPMCPHTSFLVTPRRLCLLLNKVGKIMEDELKGRLLSRK